MVRTEAGAEGVSGALPGVARDRIPTQTKAGRGQESLIGHPLQEAVLTSEAKGRPQGIPTLGLRFPFLSGSEV